MDELEVARAIAAGTLTSPQKIDTLALYAMRVSGTGVSYRKGLDEFVWRDPAIYLSQDMVDRCAGLPVIWQHPESNTLNSEEFADRVVGGVMFAYPKGDELWCIARIYDDEAIAMMEKKQLSTSPAVVFKDPSVNRKLTTEDGATLLIEGKPALVDHLAICERGVWDKGGKAAGIDVVRKDSVMTEDEKMAAADKAKNDAEEKEKEEREKADAVAKADAEAGQKIDKILAALDSIGKRMDAYDAKAKADAEREKEEEHATGKEKKPVEEAGESKKLDKAKKDGEDEDEKEEKGDPKKLAADKSKKDWDEDEKEKKDKAKKDAEAAARKDSEDMRKKIADLEAKMPALEAKIPKQLSDADYAAMANIQADADKVFSAFGDSAPRPLDGETALAYRRRIAKKLKHHSNEWRDVDLGVIAVEPKAFDIVEKKIYADAMEAATHPVDLGDDLREVRRVNRDSGHVIREFYGSPMAWMSQFTGGRRLARFNLGTRGDVK